jgi:hypothetical protein
MALKNQAITVAYTAWNCSTNAPQTGDAGNHTLKLVQDGTEAAPTNAPSEVDPVNCPGVYRLALTAGDMNFNAVTICGRSSTANVIVIPMTIVTERGVLPTAAPAGAGGFLTVGTGPGQVTPSGGGVNVTQVGGVAASPATTVPADVQTIKGQAVACSSGVTVNPNVGTAQPINQTGAGGTATVNASVAGPFKTNAAAGFEVALLDATGAPYLQAASTITVTREIDGSGTATAAGSLTRVGTTNRYYFSGEAADFNGSSATFTFSGSGGGQTVQSATYSVNTAP